MGRQHLLATMPLLLLIFAATDATTSTSSPDHVVLQTECTFTRYPTLCLDALRQQQTTGGPQPSAAGDRGELLTLLVEKARQETVFSSPLVDARAAIVADGAPDSSKVVEAIDYCGELMGMATKRLDQSLTVLKATPKSRKADIQTWLSAVITFHEACKDSVSEASASGPAASLVARKMDHLCSLASNALAIANRLPSSSSDGGRHLLDETTGYPRWLSAEDRKLLEADTIVPHAVVAQDGSGDYTTISEALEGLRSQLASGGRTVISLKAGVYSRQSVSQDNVMLVGAGKGVTVITGSSSVGGGTSMPSTATVIVTGDGFIAKDLTIQNTAGAANHQALALRISSDHAVLYHCSIVGHQDTVYAVALRQFYSECDIYGSIDYIFGNAAAIFQSCNLLYQEPHHKGINTVFANGRTDPGQNTGFVAQGCKIGAGPELSSGSTKCFLGRPWKAYSRAVVMQCNIDGSLQPSGWSPWSGSFGLSTLYFAEYGNTGPGAATGGRVRWGGFHILGAGDAAKFTVTNFLSGGGWISSSGAPFSPGL